MTITPKSIFRAELKNLREYDVPNSEGYVKLDAMENPYTLPKELRESWLAFLNNVELNRYPDPQAFHLKRALRAEYLISERHELLFGNGSDELIQMLIMSIAKPESSVLTVTPSFSMYKIISEFVGVSVTEVPLSDNYSLQTDQLCKSIQACNPSIIFLSCPNNPTGTLWSVDDVEKVIQQSRGLVVIDEAYVSFASYSMMPLLEKYSNMLLLRTISKMGLAGLRFGWLVGEPKWINELNKLRLPYNINALTQASVLFALQNIAVFNEQAKKICSQRELLISEMKKIESLQVFSSEANFILFKVLKQSAEKIFSRLLEQKVLIKNVANNRLLKNCLRVTVGTEKENKIFLTALKLALS